MLPSQSRVIEAIQPVRDRVVAIKPLAGGRVPPQDAFEYVFSEVGVAASMVGVASLEELNEDVRGARRALHVRDERP
jgi:aryl-alcohol dehydrogenase-like predicted oxidoreductase